MLVGLTMAVLICLALTAPTPSSSPRERFWLRTSMIQRQDENRRISRRGFSAGFAAYVKHKQAATFAEAANPAPATIETPPSEQGSTTPAVAAEPNVVIDVVDPAGAVVATSTSAPPTPTSGGTTPTRPAKNPDNVASIAVQDGQFVMAAMFAGTPPQRFLVAIDSAGSSSFVAGSDCATCVGAGVRLNAAKSSSVKLVTPATDAAAKIIDFGGGNAVLCNSVTETIGLAKLSAPSLPLCVASKIAGGIAQLPFDGIMGLGMSANPADGNVITAMAAAKAIPRALIGLDLDPSVFGQSRLFLGENDATLSAGLVSGPMVANQPGLVTTFETVSLSGTAFTAANVPGLIETTLSVVLMPMAAFTQLIAAIPGAKPDLDSGPPGQPDPGAFEIPCNAPGNLDMKLGTGTVSIPLSKFTGDPTSLSTAGGLCRFLIIGDTQSQAFALGIPFLELVYTSVDYDAKTIGFALMPT
ncbi:aspartic peptidase domain-containing protein [Phlyctochytrium arcticum]|nr:aspartic peptidase domain-containing protein [Phlyctochytrium arcticum]